MKNGKVKVISNIHKYNYQNVAKIGPLSDHRKSKIQFIYTYNQHTLTKLYQNEL